MVAAQFLKLSGLSDQTLGKVRRKQCVLKRGALACSGNLILANMLGCIARHWHSDYAANVSLMGTGVKNSAQPGVGVGGSRWSRVAG